MTVEDLEHIFRHQLHPEKPEEREENLYYMIIEGSTKLVNRFDYNKGFDQLLPLLDNFIFEGYKDRMPYFVKPEVIV